MSMIETDVERVTFSGDEDLPVKALDFGHNQGKHGPEVGFGIVTNDGKMHRLFLPTDLALNVTIEMLIGIQTSEMKYREKFGDWHKKNEA